MRAYRIAVLLLLLTSACAGRGPNPVAALDRIDFTLDGLERRAFVYAPPALPPGPRPLVFVMHGGGGRGDGMARQVGRTMHGLADRDGFVVVYPHAHDRLWDFGEEALADRLDVRVDDRRYFETLLDELPRRFSVDPDRVFVTGISRGGQAAFYMACHFPGRIRAIAAVTMSLPDFMFEPCRDAAPLGVAILNGTEDPLVPYAGGDIEIAGRKRGEVLSTDATVAFWRERNGCLATPTSERRIDPVDDATHVDRSAWTDCEPRPGGPLPHPGRRPHLAVRLPVSAPLLDRAGQPGRGRIGGGLVLLPRIRMRLPPPRMGFRRKPADIGRQFARIRRSL